MIWEEDKQDRDLHQCYKQLIQLRKECPALRTSQFGFLQADMEERPFTYKFWPRNLLYLFKDGYAK